MSFLSRLFGNKKAVAAAVTTTEKKIASVAAKGVETKAPAAVKEATTQVAQQVKRTPTMADTWASAKVYYGIDTTVNPTIRRSGNLSERIYKCKDGGEVVVSYASHGKGNSSLRVAKTGNPKDCYRGDFYPNFYSDLKTSSHTGRYGEQVHTTVRKKGANRQVLSSQNGRATEDVHTPLKRWEKTHGWSGNGRVDSNINPWNPRDFDRFLS